MICEAFRTARARVLNDVAESPRVRPSSGHPGRFGRGQPAHVAVPGVALVAVCYGFARYGYGLLVPDMRASFSLDGTAIGVIASGAYIAYLFATLAAVSVIGRLGPRRTVLLGGMMAVVGMVTIAAAPDVAVLTIGVVVAGSSSGFAFPPFAALAADHIGAEQRGNALAAISSGTGWGISIAAPIAIMVGHDWRGAWLAFAAITVIVVVAAQRLLPFTSASSNARTTSPLRLSWFWCPTSGPLLFTAFLVGLASSAYWTFGPDIIQNAQGSTSSRALFVAVGISSIGGSFAASIVRSIPAPTAFRACAFLLAGALLLLAATPDRLMLVTLSGLTFGVAYSLLVAIQVLWSDDVFVTNPAAGLAATMFMLGLGQIIGPTLAGAIADHNGADTAFALAAAAMASTLLSAPPRTMRTATQPRPHT
jgi:predicted MFS family arabinose efflux permease